MTTTATTTLATSNSNNHSEKLLSDDFRKKFTEAAQKGVNGTLLNNNLGLTEPISTLLHKVTGSQVQLPQIFEAEKQLKNPIGPLWYSLKLLGKACAAINSNKTDTNKYLNELETNLQTIKQLAA